MKDTPTRLSLLDSRFDIVCFSHLRWDFVFQRPQHLMTRFAKRHRVFVIEEPIAGSTETRLFVRKPQPNVTVATPHIGVGTPAESVEKISARLIAQFASENAISEAVHWFYTPMMLPFASQLARPVATVYDCMDELSAFKGAPRGILERESELLRTADVVFTGGRSLYEAKRDRHPNVTAFPSSVETEHFRKALQITEESPAQAAIARPRVGFVGVLDERLDAGLMKQLAELRPDLNFVMVGPVVKISESDLPRRANIHYLGMQAYEDLPGILAGWDVALMPFAINEATRFISPTKTPEYLAAGLPVVSTPIADVVDPYGKLGLVRIASNAAEFSEAIDLARKEDKAERLERVDAFLSRTSWTKTWEAMSAKVAEAVARRAVEHLRQAASTAAGQTAAAAASATI
jgi:UDP-galactopyranose mutase